MWRKRPVAILSEDVSQKIEKEVPEYAKKFKQMDKQAQEQMVAHIGAEKRSKFESFMKKYLRPKLEKYESQKADREKILGHPEFVEADYETKQYYEEALVEETLQPIPQ